MKKPTRSEYTHGDRFSVFSYLEALEKYTDNLEFANSGQQLALEKALTEIDKCMKIINDEQDKKHSGSKRS